MKISVYAKLVKSPGPCDKCVFSPIEGDTCPKDELGNNLCGAEDIFTLDTYKLLEKEDSENVNLAKKNSCEFCYFNDNKNIPCPRNTNNELLCSNTQFFINEEGSCYSCFFNKNNSVSPCPSNGDGINLCGVFMIFSLKTK